MTGASKAFDPIAAAEAEIAGSRVLIAAVARDLTQHERWLAHYQLAERRHARRLMVRAVIAHLDALRLRLLHALKRIALRGLRLARIAGNFLGRETAAFLVMLARALAACEAWLRPRLSALSLRLRAWLAAAWAFTVSRSRSVALRVRVWAAAFWAWSLAEERRLTVAARHRLAAAQVWGATQARLLAQGSRNSSLALIAWTRKTSRATAAMLRASSVKAWAWLATQAAKAAAVSEKSLKAGFAFACRHGEAAARTSAAAANASLRWASSEANALVSMFDKRRAGLVAASRQKGQMLRLASLGLVSSTCTFAAKSWGSLREVRRAVPDEGGTHRALVVRRSTALICIEPCRARLPAHIPLQAGTVSSYAGRASP
ncbi:MAG TPA: hypothetical protein VNJ31_11680 [Methyloceanibacter sp.]|nr:hypothetical protein [Methyloceanibacter sp.]